ncbi:14845_t:CDS:2 [Cetraspora pellucida]|uniref:14845_t:CDS:1 n=1 Tax=Cetraspora pellucida TaxID=1433469 RepID=A0A9N9HW45_9GLOM|nr:14845_t:CDS:2 [Cetraspora pellucida]
MSSSCRFSTEINSSSLSASSLMVLAFVTWMEIIYKILDWCNLTKENAVQYAINGLKKCAAQVLETK